MAPVVRPASLAISETRVPSKPRASRTRMVASSSCWRVSSEVTPLRRPTGWNITNVFFFVDNRRYHDRMALSVGEGDVERVEDALVDGDVPIRGGTARAALAYPTFRRVYFGAFLSNVGTWMQNVILAAFIYQQTESLSYVGLF